MRFRPIVIVAVTLALSALASTAWGSDTTFASPLVAIVGQGSGSVVGATTAKNHGTLDVQGVANVQGTSANTEFTLQRSLDVIPDGVCDTSGGFVELGSFTTSASGAGAVHFEREAPLPSGQAFDVLFQLVGADGTLLQSNCLTVTVK